MNSWANIRTITKRELGAYFSSPLAYIFIVIFLLLCGFFAFAVRPNLFDRGEASLSANFFFWHPWFYLFLVPAVGMRLWAEERRVGTLELLLTMPITAWQAIVGKFLASWAFLALALALTFPAILTVRYLGHPDMGIIFCGYIGSFLLAGAYLAISCLTSAMTRNQVISFIVSVVVCLLFLLAGSPPVTNLISQIDTTAPLFYIPYGLITLAAVFFASYVVVTGFDIYERKRILLSAVLTIFVGIIDVILIGVLAYRSLNQ